VRNADDHLSAWLRHLLHKKSVDRAHASLHFHSSRVHGLAVEIQSHETCVRFVNQPGCDALESNPSAEIICSFPGVVSGPDRSLSQYRKTIGAQK
jgi:hypothetical protein